MSLRQEKFIQHDDGGTIDGSGKAVSLLALRPSSVHNCFFGGWFAMDLHFPKKLASHEKLTGNDIRVFLAFLPELDFQNKPVPVNQKKLAEEIGMKKTTLNRSLRRLIDTGFLVKSGVPGHPLFAFPPTAVWRGEGKGHVIAINEWRRTKAAEAAARRATTTEVD